MIRDMETLLNTVQTPEIKEYLTEALICYSNGAYRAAVIIAMIGGIHDLHNKIKDLSPSNKAIADLEKEVSRKKDKLQPYERFLIDQCATSAIDVLNANEAKELNRCFDIRNDCAHPSDYNCSAETARYVFSTIIDILASKPVLLGQQHIKKITEDINSDRFFPCIEKEEIQKIVVARLDTYSNRICKPLAQALVKQIQIDTMQGNFNKTYFLANMYDKIPYDFDSIISPLLMSSQYNTHIMYMLWANETLIKYLSEENLKRLLKIFPMYIQGNCGYNQIVQSVVLSKKLSSSVFDNDIKELLNSKYAGMSDNESDIWIYCISHMSNSSRDTLIKNDYCNNIQNCIVFQSQKYQEIFHMCNNPQLYSNFINNLSSKIEEADYTISNPNTEILNQLSEEFLDSLNFNDICRVIYAILRGQQGYGREVKMLYANLANLHIFKLYTQDIFTKFDSSTLKELLAYHVSSENILYLVKILNNIDATFIDKFSSLVEEYMEEETDTWNQFVLENVLRAFPDRNRINDFE